MVPTLALRVLKETENELKVVERVRNEFMSIVSHELRTPLTALLLQLELEKRRLNKGEQSAQSAMKAVESLIDTTEKHAHHLARLIDDMLDSAKLSNERVELNLQRVDLGKSVRTVLKTFADQISESGSSILTRIEPEIVGYWDAARIEQVISHIFSNALKYGSGQSIEISVTSDGNYARLVVCDHGIGIHPKDLDRIFERFERAVSADYISGLGLGLYISRKIIELHHGMIWAECSQERGGGTTFVMTLPLAESPNPLLPFNKGCVS